MKTEDKPKWTVARMFNEDVLMHDGVLSAITVEEVCEKLNQLDSLNEANLKANIVAVDHLKNDQKAKQSRIQELEEALRHWLDMRVTYVHGSPVIDANNKAERIAIENAISAYKGLKSKL